MRRSPQVTLSALSLSAVVYGLMQCLVIPALPEIQRELHASSNAASWVLTAFLISASVATPTIGRLGDMYGKERVLLITLVILAVGTVISALAESMTVLIAGRVVQGVSGGFIPLGFAIVRDEFPPAKVARGLGLMSALLGVGSGIGVLLAGPIIQHLGFRWLFWVPLGVTVAAGIATVLFVPESAIKTSGKVDWLGGMLLALGLVALLVAISHMSVWGWLSSRTLGALAAAALLLYAWVQVELRVKQPLVDMRMMTIRAVWTTNLVTLLVGVGMFAAFVLIPEYVQEPRATGYGFGASVNAGGMYLLPMTTMLLVFGSLAGVFERTIGPRRTLIAATLVSALAWLLLLAAHDRPWQIYFASGMVGSGNGMALAAMSILITGAVKQHQTGVANGVNNVMRTIGGAIGAQVVASFIAHNTIHNLPSEHAYELSFLTGTIALGMAFIVSRAVPRRRLSAVRV